GRPRERRGRIDPLFDAREQVEIERGKERLRRHKPVGDGGDVVHILDLLNPLQVRHDNHLTARTIRPATERLAIAPIASAARSKGSTRSIWGRSFPSLTHCKTLSAARELSSGKRSAHAPVKTPTIE